MATDLARFPFPSLSNLQAATITEALAHDAADGGFVFLTFQARQPEAFAEQVRQFAHELRCNSPANRLTDIKAFRQVRREEAGGAMPYDQPICDQLFQQAPPIEMIVLNNPAANWIMLLETDSLESALALAEGLDAGANGMNTLVDASLQHSVGAFRNARQYARVSYDPDLVQFFNLFPGPNNVDVMWKAWQESLPWFFEYTELRSSFPLLALREKQPFLLVNHAHFDSLKHFIHSAIHDPYLPEHIMKEVYGSQHMTAFPFFCKIVPV